MRKTVIVTPNSNQHNAIDALFKEINFEETERFSTGGLHSDVQLILTYEGRSCDYKEDSYVEIPSTGGYSYYYSLSFTEGSFVKSKDEFVSAIKDRVKPFTIYKF